jgi:hypothetical protein
MDKPVRCNDDALFLSIDELFIIVGPWAQQIHLPIRRSNKSSFKVDYGNLCRTDQLILYTSYDVGAFEITVWENY